MSELKPAPSARDVLTSEDGVSRRILLAAVLAAGYFAVALPAMAGRSLDFKMMAASALLGGILVGLSAIDCVSFRLPDPLTIGLAIVGLAATWWLELDRVEYRIAAMLTGYAALFVVSWLYLKFRERHGLGLGDAKLFGAAGAWVGVDGLPGVLLWASVSALVIVGLTFGRSTSLQMRLPFGPFLAAGIWLVWLYGPPFSGG